MARNGWRCFRKAQQTTLGNANFPQRITVRTPSLSLGGQNWNNLSIVSEPASNGSIVQAQGREINATLAMRNNAPWLANINFFITTQRGESVAENKTPASPFADNVSFRGWPDVQLRCAECWMWGKDRANLTADVAIKGDRQR
ncbi:hypothetical protein ACNKHK_20990 [Shigella flexneri]